MLCLPWPDIASDRKHMLQSEIIIIASAFVSLYLTKHVILHLIFQKRTLYKPFVFNPVYLRMF